MFELMKNLKEIKGLETFDTSKGLGFDEMFSNCQSLEKLDLSSFDTRNATNGVSCSGNGGKTYGMQNMFYNTYKLKEVKLGENFSFVGDGASSTNSTKLLTPSSSNIDGADGNWYNSAGTAFTAAEIPSLVADTYYAVNPAAN